MADGAAQGDGLVRQRAAGAHAAPAAIEQGAGRAAGAQESVFAKLAAFSLLMVVGPLAAYLFGMRVLFPGDVVSSAGVAVVVINVILVAYVVVAYTEAPVDGGVGRAKAE